MKSKEPGTIRQLFAFVGENNGKMLLSIFLAVLGELFGIGPFLMVAVLADALYRGTATPKLVLFLCGGAAVCQIIKMLLTAVLTFLGTLFGQRLLRKHFQKAGIVG